MGFTGQTKQLSGVSPDIAGLREGLSSFLSGRGYDSLFGPESSEELLAPYRQFFDERNKMTLAQAKESAGNLTGSGFANTLGVAAGRSATEQGAFLSQLLEQRRQAESNRFAQLLLGLGTSGVGPPQNVYQPGFLDYLFQAGSAGAQAYATAQGGGAGGGGAPGSAYA